MMSLKFEPFPAACPNEVLFYYSTVLLFLAGICQFPLSTPIKNVLQKLYFYKVSWLLENVKYIMTVTKVGKNLAYWLLLVLDAGCCSSYLVPAGGDPDLILPWEPGAGQDPRPGEGCWRHLLLKASCFTEMPHGSPSWSSQQPQDIGNMRSITKPVPFFYFLFFLHI